MSNGSAKLPNQCAKMNIRRLLLTITVGVFGAAPVLAEAQSTRSVMILRGDIFMEAGSSPRNRQLTNDSLPKSLPTWSKDGTHVAYVEMAFGLLANANLIVIDTNDQATPRVTSRTAIKPSSPNEI